MYIWLRVPAGIELTKNSLEQFKNPLRSSLGIFEPSTPAPYRL